MSKIKSNVQSVTISIGKPQEGRKLEKQHPNDKLIRKGMAQKEQLEKIKAMSSKISVGKSESAATRAEVEDLISKAKPITLQLESLFKILNLDQAHKLKGKGWEDYLKEVKAGVQALREQKIDIKDNEAIRDAFCDAVEEVLDNIDPGKGNPATQETLLGLFEEIEKKAVLSKRSSDDPEIKPVLDQFKKFSKLAKVDMIGKTILKATGLLGALGVTTGVLVPALVGFAGVFLLFGAIFNPMSTGAAGTAFAVFGAIGTIAPACLGIVASGGAVLGVAVAIGLAVLGIWLYRKHKVLNGCNTEIEAFLKTTSEGKKHFDVNDKEGFKIRKKLVLQVLYAHKNALNKIDKAIKVPIKDIHALATVIAASDESYADFANFAYIWNDISKQIANDEKKTKDLDRRFMTTLATQAATWVRNIPDRLAPMEDDKPLPNAPIEELSDG